MDEEVTKDADIEMLKMKLQYLETTKNLEIENEKLKKEVEKFKGEVVIENLKGEVKIEKLKSEAILKNEKLKGELQEVRRGFEKLHDDYARTNWENLQKLRKLDVREFITKFENKHLIGQESRKAKFSNYAKVNPNLQSWNFTPQTFDDTFTDFYNTVCKPAHPELEIGSTLIIPQNTFNDSQLRLLGLLWENFPLPLNKLFIIDDSLEVNMVNYKEKLIS